MYPYTHIIGTYVTVVIPHAIVVLIFFISIFFISFTSFVHYIIAMYIYVSLHGVSQIKLP